MLGLLVLTQTFISAKPFGKIRAKTMVVPKSILINLRDDANIEEVLFHNFYQNRGWAKDQILLTAHISNKQNKLSLQSQDLESTMARGKIFTNELRYSIYRLTKEDAKKILSYGDAFSNAEYFLLEAFAYGGDHRYLRYKIIPADIRRNQIMGMISSGINILIGMQRFWYRDLYLNPSPPAGSSLEES
jgi:hypothetical protein